MNQQTIDQLLTLTADFYQQTAQSFSDSRHYYWAGWSELLPFIKKLSPAELKILDLGCGNARFAEFLAAKLPSNFCLKYFGWDNSVSLLSLAQEKIAQNILRDTQQLHPQTSFILDLVDFSAASFSEKLKQEQPFQLITLFGVLHHLPSAQKRSRLLQTLSRQLQPNSLLIFSLWQFMNDPRLAARIISPEKFPAALDPNQLEPNDYLLDWKKDDSTSHALRYCHHFSAEEIKQLIFDLQKTNSLQLIHHFQADGPTDNPLNTYLVFEKKLFKLLK